jgi:NAD+ synthase
MNRSSFSNGADRDLDGDLRIDPEWTARILEEFITSELHRTGFRRLVIGLSGGIDSALSAMLGARAIGAESVLGIRLPYRTSSPDSLADAQRLADASGIRMETVEITEMVDAVVHSAGEIDRLRMGNVMARMRMLVIFDRSARDRALVLGSSNKTELLLGYGTVHGDLASAINPLGDLYKTQVRALARHVGVPESILRKPPSADLWPDQSDEQELGFTYEQVDRLLALLVDARVGREETIARGFDASLVDRVWNLVVRSQFKRRPPVIAKVSTRSVGSDFRYPRDWRT